MSTFGLKRLANGQRQIVVTRPGDLVARRPVCHWYWCAREELAVRLAHCTRMIGPWREPHDPPAVDILRELVLAGRQDRAVRARLFDEALVLWAAKRLTEGL